jgi:hypothetical protein
LSDQGVIELDQGVIELDQGVIEFDQGVIEFDQAVTELGATPKPSHQPVRVQRHCASLSKG